MDDPITSKDPSRRFANRLALLRSRADFHKIAAARRLGQQYSAGWNHVDEDEKGWHGLSLPRLMDCAILYGVVENLDLRWLYPL